MPSCASCRASIPENQGSTVCSMCYGDPDHGRDGYYRASMEEAQAQAEQEYYEQMQAEERFPCDSGPA